MLSIPDEIKNLLHQDSCNKNIRIHFPNGERSDICNDLIVMDSVKFTESLCSQNELKFGLCEASAFECEVVGVGNVKGATIEVSCEIYCPSTISGAEFKPDIQEWVYVIPYGTFTISEAKRQADMNHRRIQAYGEIAWKKINDFPNNLSRFIVTKPTYNSSLYQPDLVKLLAANLEGSENSALVSRDQDYQRHYHYNISRNFYSSIKVTETVSGVTATYSKYRLHIICDRDRWSIDDSGLRLDVNGLFYLQRKRGANRELLDELKNIVQNYTNEYFLGQQTSEPYSAAFENQYTAQEIFDLHEYGSCTLNFKLPGQVTSLNTWLPIYSDWIYLYGIYDHATIEACYGDTITLEVYRATNQGTSQTKVYEKTISFKSDTTENLAISYVPNGLSLTKSFKRKSIDGGYCPDLEGFKLYDFLDSLLEIDGVFGAYNRFNNFATINIKQQFNLNPAAALYPDTDLYPEGVTGGKLLPQDYQSCWYEDEYTKPFGMVQCVYKDSNNQDIIYQLYLTGYDETSDQNKYQIYDISDNSIIKESTWTGAQIQAFCETIAANIEGVTYMPVDFVGRGLPYVEAGDTFEILTASNDSITTIVLNRTISGEQVLTDSYKSV